MAACGSGKGISSTSRLPSSAFSVSAKAFVSVCSVSAKAAFAGRSGEGSSSTSSRLSSVCRSSALSSKAAIAAGASGSVSAKACGVSGKGISSTSRLSPTCRSSKLSMLKLAWTLRSSESWLLLLTASCSRAMVAAASKSGPTAPVLLSMLPMLPILPMLRKPEACCVLPALRPKTAKMICFVLSCCFCKRPCLRSMSDTETIIFFMSKLDGTPRTFFTLSVKVRKLIWPEPSSSRMSNNSSGCSAGTSIRSNAVFTSGRWQISTNSSRSRVPLPSESADSKTLFRNSSSPRIWRCMRRSCRSWSDWAMFSVFSTMTPTMMFSSPNVVRKMYSKSSTKSKG
mmetsp:Transcript_11022/g.26036  ORF Transcript_11022/g.26036 Transcript_11022/m.26036 type:complete len:341 (-) Transcript_11022:886-1908(-)